MINLSQFDTIIFDLGGVIIDIYPQRVVSHLQSINKTPKTDEDIFAEFKSRKIIERHETGELSDDHFFIEISDIIQNDNKDGILHAWHQMLGEIPHKRIQIIQKLKETHNVLLLSNTNNLHSNKIDNYLKEKFDTSFENLFHKVYLSQKIGYRKPNKEIYDHLVSHSKISPNKAVFIDDVFENAKNAELSGIHGYHLDLQKTRLEEIFNND